MATRYQRPKADPLALIEALVALSRTDLAYADQYLHWAEGLLNGRCRRDQYQALCCDRESLARLTDQVRVATEHGDWTHLRYLAQRAATARNRMNGADAVFQLAEAVYSPRMLHVNANVLALNGVSVTSTANLRGARDAAVDWLRVLVAGDEERVEFYRWRLTHFQGLKLAEEHAPLQYDDVRKRILVAAQHGDFEGVLSLLDSVSATQPRTHVVGAISLEPSPTRVERLVAPFPTAAVARARCLGLSQELVPEAKNLNLYLTDDTAQWSSGESPNRAVPWAESGLYSGQADSLVAASLRENLDLLLTHPFVSSAGRRYLPWFGPEALLVEMFPETDPDAATELMARLGLSHRRGMPWPVIEDALRTHSVPLCTELGLDPLEFRLTCIPFDAYLRLAPRQGWGRQELWTRFDGYRVTDQLHLHPLVGGDVRYGGPGDLCSVDHSFESERLMVRLAIVRRERFLVRDTERTDQFFG